MTFQNSRNALPRSLLKMNGLETGGSIVFLPDFGGHVLYAQPIQKILSAEYSCFGARLAPDMVEALDKLSLVDIAKRFAVDLHEAGIPRPIHICGFSFAGLLAFETARHLAVREKIGELLILDTRIRPRKFVSRMRNPVREALYAARYIVYRLPDLLTDRQDPFILQRYGQIRMDLRKHAEAHRTIIRQMYDKMAAYHPRRWTGSATIFRARENRWQNPFDDLGWSGMIDGTLSIVDVPGDHLSMLRKEENAKVLVRKMNLRLMPGLKEQSDV